MSMPVGVNVDQPECVNLVKCVVEEFAAGPHAQFLQQSYQKRADVRVVIVETAVLAQSVTVMGTAVLPTAQNRQEK